MHVGRTLVAATALLVSGWLAAQAKTYSLAGDWSDTSNPNGPWAYYGGTALLPAQADIGVLFGGLPFTQPAFAPSLKTPPGFLPLIFKAAGTVPGLSYNVGDVVMHTSGGPDSNGAYGLGNIIFTSPIAGIADISGTIHPVRAIGRPTSWHAFVPVALGPFAHGSFDGTTIAPETFDFSGVNLAVGEQFEFFTGSLALGDLLDVSLNVNFASAAPEPSTWTMLLLGFAGIGFAGYRRMRKQTASPEAT